TTHATASRLPHVDCAAQGTRRHTQRRLTPLVLAASRTACETHRTYRPWFFHAIVPPLPSSRPAHGHVASTNAWMTLDASSHAPPPPLCPPPFSDPPPCSDPPPRPCPRPCRFLRRP